MSRTGPSDFRGDDLPELSPTRILHVHAVLVPCVLAESLYRLRQSEVR
jgi:hypothetical protein